jgi:hypothetical protein
MIVTRDLDEAVARVGTLLSIHATAEHTGPVRVFRIRALLESFSLLDFVKAAMLWTRSAVRREPMPLPVAGSRARYAEAWGTILAGVEPAEVVAELH